MKKPKTKKKFKESADIDTSRTKTVDDGTENVGMDSKLKSESEDTVYESGESFYINYRELIGGKTVFKNKKGGQENSFDSQDSIDP